MFVFEVDRHDLHRTRLVAEARAVGGTLLRVDAFALTSNNITYAAFGDMLQYWSFFPATGEWGRVPVWGFASIVDSPTLDTGRRVYGYLPMADELVVQTGRVDARGFVDTSAHRQAMAATYNRYLFTDHDAIYDPAREAQHMVLWPLFFTSFLIDDFLADNDFFGASSVVISSASSKTAIGTAFLCAQRPGISVVGLTSAAHAGFVEALGCYERTVTYDDLHTLPGIDAVYVDIAGNRDVQVTVHDSFAQRLKHSMVVGSTHWDHDTDVPPTASGPQPVFFFAPSQIAKRVEDWGQATLDQRVGGAWHRYSAWTDAWLRIERYDGAAAVDRAYRTLLQGHADPRVGYVCSMSSNQKGD